MTREELQTDQFKHLKESYTSDMTEDSADYMAENALRGLAQQWTGCVACAFSRKYKQGHLWGGGWTYRRCSLGLKQDTCGNHLPFPPQKPDS